MTRRIGELFSTTEHTGQRLQISSDGLLRFVSRRERRQERIGNATLILAWTAAILAMIGGIWFAAA